MILRRVVMFVGLFVTAMTHNAFAEDVFITGFPKGLQYLLAPLAKDGDENYASFKSIDRIVSARTGIRVMIPKIFPSAAPPEDRARAVKIVLDQIAAGEPGLFITLAPPQRYIDQLKEADLAFPEGLEAVQIGEWECDIVQGADYKDTLPGGKYISRITKAQLSRVLLSPKTILWKEFHVNLVQAAFPVTIGYEKISPSGYALASLAKGKKFGPNAVDMSVVSDVQQNMGLYGSLVAADHKENGNANGLSVIPRDRVKSRTAVNIVKPVDFSLSGPIYVYISQNASPSVHRVVDYLKKHN